MRKKSLNLFVSFSQNELREASRLINLLGQVEGVHVSWIEESEGIREWKRKLKTRLKKCDLFLLLLSPYSMNSPRVLFELGAALGLEKPVVPVLPHPEIPTRIPRKMTTSRPIKME